MKNDYLRYALIIQCWSCYFVYKSDGACCIACHAHYR